MYLFSFKLQDEEIQIRDIHCHAQNTFEQSKTVTAFQQIVEHQEKHHAIENTWQLNFSES